RSKQNTSATWIVYESGAIFPSLWKNTADENRSPLKKNKPNGMPFGSERTFSRFIFKTGLSYRQL
ncbi:hypothetical protein, partial [Alistipes ihumii]